MNAAPGARATDEGAPAHAAVKYLQPRIHLLLWWLWRWLLWQWSLFQGAVCFRCQAQQCACMHCCWPASCNGVSERVKERIGSIRWACQCCACRHCPPPLLTTCECVVIAAAAARGARVFPPRFVLPPLRFWSGLCLFLPFCVMVVLARRGFLCGCMFVRVYVSHASRRMLLLPGALTPPPKLFTRLARARLRTIACKCCP